MEVYVVKSKKEIQILKTDAFHKIVIDFIFPCQRCEDFSIYGNLLVRLLTKKTKKYPNEEALSNALIENYVMDFSFSKSNCGENWFYTFHIVLPDKKVLKDGEYDYEKTLKFVTESIYEPYALNHAFYESELALAKKKLKTYIEGGLKDINHYAHIRLEKLIDKEGYYKDSLYKHQEDIEKVTEENLYSYYKETIGNVCPLVFVLGNIDENFIDIMDKILPNKKVASFLPYQVKPFSVQKDTQIIEEVKEYNQSIVEFAYKIADFKKEDRVMLSLLQFLLSSQSSRILQNYLRDRDKLVYVAKSDYDSYHGAFLITAQIYRDKKEKTISTMKEVMKLLENVSFVEEKLENVKMRKKINLERQKDSIVSILGDFEVSYFKSRDTLEEEYEKVKDITAEEFVSFIKRLKLDTIYYLEGSKDE